MFLILYYLNIIQYLQSRKGGGREEAQEWWWECCKWGLVAEDSYFSTVGFSPWTPSAPGFLRFLSSALAGLFLGSK